MADSTEDRAARPSVQAVPPPAPAPAPEEPVQPHVPVACPVAWCPVCLAVSATQPLRPDVIEHLLKAGTELLLALRSVVDTRADEVAGDPDAEATGTRLEKIDLG